LFQFTVIDDTIGALAEYTVEGTTYAPTGAITDSHEHRIKLTPAIVKLAEVAALCNDAKIVYNQVNCFASSQIWY
jgi:Ca2+ transporting ATPase